MNTKLRANTNRVLHTELKSWKQNKLEEKKLARKHEQVDKNMLSARKIHLFEKDLINKDITENISKKSPTTDEYLNRSYNRYANWRARERERLDRRYRGIYKTYLREFSDLGIDEETLKKARKKHAEEQECKLNPKEPNDRELDETETAIPDTEEEEKDIQTALVDFSKLQLGERRRYSVATTSSQYVPGPDDRVRRKSAGTSLPLEVLENLRRSSLPLFNENSSEADEDIANARSSTPVDKLEGKKTVADDSDIPDKERKSRRASLAVTSGLANSKEMQNIISKGRSGRRSSLIVTSELGTSARGKGRRASEDASLQTPKGVRLSRRSSIPNIEIPLMYGN